MPWVDVHAGHDGADLVEGLHGHVLVDVDAAGVDHEAPFHAAHVLQARGSAADGDRLGSTPIGPSSMPSGSGPWSTCTGMTRESTSSTRTTTPVGSIADDANTRVDGEDVDRDLDGGGADARLHRGEVDAGPEAVAGDLRRHVVGGAVLDAVDGAGVVQQGSADRAR